MLCYEYFIVYVRLKTETNLGGHSRNSDNLQIVNETVDTMFQQY
jgi:hypothetical protein